MSKNNRVVFDGNSYIEIDKTDIFVEISKEQARELYDLYFEILKVGHAYGITTVKSYCKGRNGKGFFLSVNSVKYMVREHIYDMYYKGTY